ncbi:MAG: TraM recognition domain-containing protein, partial [Pseudomonadota bacterium]
QKIASAGQNAWIDKEALSLSHLITVARAHLDPEAATLGGLLDFAQSSLDDITRFMEVASEHREVEGGFVAAGASAFLNRYGPDNERELRWVLQSMAESFGLFAQGSRLRQTTATTTIDVASFKKRPRALFLQTQDRYVDVAAPLILAVLDMLVETLAHAPGPHRVTILAEEFSVLPFSRAVLKWVRVYRSLGIRLAVVVQDRSGFSRFQKEGGHKSFEQNSVKLYFGLSDADHLQHLERRAGRRAVMVPNLSTSLGVQLPGRSSGGAETLTPVLPVSEIARIGAGRALLDIPGQPLFLLDRRPWWEQEDIAHLFRDTRPGADGGLA